MKKLLAFAAVLGLLALLNPSEARHREGFAEAFRTDHPVLSLFGADRVAPSLLTRSSYGVLSVTEGARWRFGTAPVACGMIRMLVSRATSEDSDARDHRLVRSGVSQHSKSESRS
ncbi:MAG TPA: hypothetical protein VGV85_04325 [Longimicrobiaceae bacterium]|nr:hypothetical protein [Longimicrobiaceae bacterium]